MCKGWKVNGASQKLKDTHGDARRRLATGEALDDLAEHEAMIAEAEREEDEDTMTFLAELEDRGALWP
jgi:hypothetical protein